MAEIALAAVVRALRSELEEAMAAGEGERLRFEAQDLEVELQVGVTRCDEAKGGVRFWVLELGGGASRSSESVQKVTLKLRPVVDERGTVWISEATDTDPRASAGNHGKLPSR